MPLWTEGEAAEDMSSTTLSLLPSTRSGLYLLLPDRSLILKQRPPSLNPSWQLPSTEASACNWHFWLLQSLSGADSDTNIPWQQLKVTLIFPGSSWESLAAAQGDTHIPWQLLKVKLIIPGSSCGWHSQSMAVAENDTSSSHYVSSWGWYPHFLTAAKGDTHNPWQQLRVISPFPDSSWGWYPQPLTAAEGDTPISWQQLRVIPTIPVSSWGWHPQSCTDSSWGWHSDFLPEADIHASSSYRFVRIAIQRLKYRVTDYLDQLTVL